MRAPSWAFAVALLLLAGSIVVLGAATDVRGRGTSPETTVRAYFAALERGDEDAALSAIEPSVRVTWQPFIANGLWNSYRLEGIAVHEPSFLRRLGGQESGPKDVTIFVRVTEWADGATWLGTPRVSLVKRSDGGWFLARPPLAPE